MLDFRDESQETFPFVRSVHKHSSVLESLSLSILVILVSLLRFYPFVRVSRSRMLRHASRVQHLTQSQCWRAHRLPNRSAESHNLDITAAAHHSQPQQAADVVALAHTAHVGVSESEREVLSKNMSELITWASRIQSLELEGVQPSLGLTVSHNASSAREDEISHFCATSDLLSMMPEQHERFALVPSAREELEEAEVLDTDGSAASNSNVSEPSESLLGLELRVGKVTHVERHAEADKLYVERVDVGEEEERTICSGLVPFMAPEDLQDSLVCVFCNMKAKKMRGVASQGMLLAASTENKEHVELLRPPDGAKVGERITWMCPDYAQPEPFAANKERVVVSKLEEVRICIVNFSTHEKASNCSLCP